MLRAIKWQSKYIEPTNEKASFASTMTSIQIENDPDVPRLLSALGHMPFAVTLMANLGAESRASAKDLLDSWSKSGTKILSNDPEQSMDQSIRLSVESDLVQRNPDAVLLLATLSLLPAGTAMRICVVGSSNQSRRSLCHCHFIAGGITG